jgi:hypothetical protein
MYQNMLGLSSVFPWSIHGFHVLESTAEAFVMPRSGRMLGFQWADIGFWYPEGFRKHNRPADVLPYLPERGQHSLYPQWKPSIRIELPQAVTYLTQAGWTYIPLIWQTPYYILRPIQTFLLSSVF